MAFVYFALGVIIGLLVAVKIIIISYILHKNKLNIITKLTKYDEQKKAKAVLIEPPTAAAIARQDLIRRADIEGKDLPLKDLL